MPARGIAEIRHLARGVRRVQRVREPNGARARGAALRASGLFRRRRREFKRRLLNPSTQHDDRHVPLPPGNSERDFAVVGYAALSLQSPQMQLVEEFWEHRAIESDLARPLIEADPEARLN